MKHFAHSGYMEIIRQRDGANLDNFNQDGANAVYWIIGGAAIIVSYLIIIAGTVVFLKSVAEEIKCGYGAKKESKKRPS